jgi:MFS family permease
MAKKTPDPVGTLSIGNVITTATTLYKSNFKRYFQVSLRATGWVLAIVLSAFGLAVIGGILSSLTKSWLIAIPLIVGWIAVSSYFLARHLTDRAVICRLAYQESIEQPETISVATQQLQPRIWAFLRLSLLLGLYVFLIVLVSYFALALIVGGFVAVIVYGLKLSPNSPPVALLIGLFTIGMILAWIVVLMRYYARWFVAELPLAIESKGSARISLRRSKELSATFVNRITVILTIAVGITLPITLFGSLPSLFGQVMSDPRISTDSSTQTVGVILIGVGFLISTIGDLFVMPFWQVIKAIIYCDLRNRQEGCDLIL